MRWNRAATGFHTLLLRGVPLHPYALGIGRAVRPGTREGRAVVQLKTLAGGADRFAVIDCETTGLFKYDRIVEAAIVTVDLDGSIAERWETLIHPQRDVGATHIHGLTAHALRDAPTFEDVAGDIALRLHGACVVAHNLPFDARMFTAEFDRLGGSLLIDRGVDTLRATNAKLAVACAAYGVALTDAHSAGADAEATAQLMLRAAGACSPGAPAVAPTDLLRASRVLRRSDSTRVAVPDPPYLSALAARIDHSQRAGGALAYLDMLERALSDSWLDAEERRQLGRLARDLGLTTSQVKQLHRQYVDALLDTAVGSGSVSATEYRSLQLVASMLGVDDRVVDQRTRSARSVGTPVKLTSGLSVTFTGDDPRHPRAALIAHAQKLGLHVGSGVTRDTDVVVAADPSSSSAKAEKAHRYGLPIVSTTDFARASRGSTLRGVRSTTGRLPNGGSRPAPRSAHQAVRAQRWFGAAEPARTAEETLVCQACGRSWQRVRTRGRKPHTCPTCSGRES